MQDDSDRIARQAMGALAERKVLGLADIIEIQVAHAGAYGKFPGYLLVDERSKARLIQEVRLLKDTASPEGIAFRQTLPAAPANRRPEDCFLSSLDGSPYFSVFSSKILVAEWDYLPWNVIGRNLLADPLGLLLREPTVKLG